MTIPLAELVNAISASSAEPTPDKPLVFTKALSLNHKNPLFDSALDAHKNGRFDEAMQLYTRIIIENPSYAVAYSNMGVVLRHLKKWDAAIACQRRAIALHPNNASYYSNLGNTLRNVNYLDEAIEKYEKAIELDKTNSKFWHNLGLALYEAGANKKALACFDTALKLEPKNIQPRWDRALLILRSGDLKRGFKEYEVRWQLKDMPKHGFDVNRHWNGKKFNGKTLLLHQEQGFGDAIQFIRYVPLVKARGGTVMVQCHPALMRLFKSVKGIDHIISKNADPGVWDLHCPLLSVPRVLESTLQTIPVEVPYLKPPKSKNTIIQAPSSCKCKLGIVWGGSLTFKNDYKRSVLLNQFFRFSNRPDVSVYSLQKGEYVKEIILTGAQALIADVGLHLRDFADTATAINQLDLVMTVDTAVGHLAGALGKQVWVILPFCSDWRWLRNRSDSPWYPTMTLFRQKRPGDWDDVFTRMQNAFDKFIDRK